VAKVDFYILRGTGELERQQFACRLAEKAYRLDNRVHIHAMNHESAQKLDDLLWTFRDGGFLPHLPADQLESADPEGRTPVLLGHGEAPAGCDGLLINLADEVPLFFSRFERVAEIVSGPDQGRSLARERFRFYRDRGYPLDTHRL